MDIINKMNDTDDDEYFESDYIPYVIILILYILSLLYFYNSSIVEEFNSFTSCVKQGYDNNFCLNVPFEGCVNCDLELKDKFTPKRFFTYNS